MAGAAPLWVRGRRGAEGAGGRDECNIGRGKNNTAPRPVPPAHPGLWNPAFLPTGPLEPRDRGALGNLGHLIGALGPGHPEE